MKFKEIPRTATFAWCPRAGVPLLATGTAAGAIDADFSSSSKLELWHLDLLDRSAAAFEAQPSSEIEVDTRFHDIAWAPDTKTFAAAMESGVVDVYTVDNEWKPVRAHRGTIHNGAVHAVSFNPLDAAKLASGGANGQVFIWDTLSFADPFAPGVESARHDDIGALAWNNRVAHILATGGTTGFTSIWDLKKRREVIHLHFSNAAGHRVPVSSVVWHPENSTKLLTTSPDDNEPAILLWDLRNANTPEKILRGHQRGILSADWCLQDPSLLITSGKDNRTLLWNPTTGDQLGEYPISVEWTIKTRFHPKMPDIFATASFDGKITVQALQDVSTDKTSPTETKAVNSDDFWESQTVVDTVHPSFSVRQPPAWLLRPVSAKYGFGGKIAVTRKMGPHQSCVTVSRVKDLEIHEDTHAFSEAVKQQSIDKIVAAHAKSDEFDWKLLNDLAQNANLIESYAPSEEIKLPSKEEFNEFDIIAGYKPDDKFDMLKGSEDTQIVTKLVLQNRFEDAVNALLASNNIADALLLASFGPPELLNRAQVAYLQKAPSEKPYLRAAWAVATNNVGNIIDHSEIEAWPYVLRAALAAENPSTRAAQLGDRLLKKGKRENALLAYLAGQNVNKAAALWLGESPELEAKLVKDGLSTAYAAHVKVLQNIVEKIIVASKATSKAEMSKVDDATDEDNEPIYNAYREYADIASSQGDLELATIFLDRLPAKYSKDKERVAHASKPSISTTGQSSRPVSGLRYNNLPITQSPVKAARMSYTPVAGAPSTLQAQPSIVPGAGPPTPIGATSVPASQPVAPQTMRRTPIVPNPYAIGTSTSAPLGQAPNPYAGANTAAASAAASLADTSNPYASGGYMGPSLSGPPAPPASGPPSASALPPKSGWNDLPAKAAIAPRRTPAAPTMIPPPPSMTAAKSPTPGVPTAPVRGGTPVGPPPRAGQAPQSSARAAPPPTGSYNPAHAANMANPMHAGPFQEPSARAPMPVNPYAPPISCSPAPANPYAPPSRSGSVPSMSTPPPTKAVPPPPAASGPMVAAAPPPGPASLAETPQGQASSPVVAAPEASKQKYPAGDRSHVPPEARPIVDLLTAELARIQPIISSQYPKPYRDTVRRLNMLFDHLNNQELLLKDTISDMVRLANAVKSQNYEEAKIIQDTIQRTRSEQCGQWMTGVKRLVHMSEAVPLGSTTAGKMST